MSEIEATIHTVVGLREDGTWLVEATAESGGVRKTASTAVSRAGKCWYIEASGHAMDRESAFARAKSWARDWAVSLLGESLAGKEEAR